LNVGRVMSGFLKGYLSEGHLHHRVAVEVEAGHGLAVLQHLHRGALLRLGLLRGGEELHNHRERGREGP